MGHTNTPMQIYNMCHIHVLFDKFNHVLLK